jgi:hypothetical protein
VADGSVGLMCAGTVGELSEPPELFDGAVATLPTEVTVPGVVLLSGSVIVTRSPALTSDCRSGSSATLTVRAVELACSTGPVAGAPRLACSMVTRAAVGKNTTSPRDSSPVWSTPRCFCSFSTPALVAQLNSSQAESTSALSTYPSATRSWFNCATSAPVTSAAVAPSARAR